MPTRHLLFAFLFLMVGCSPRQQYDPATYYDKQKQQWILARIIAHIAPAPPYVLMQDRLKPEHEDFYWDQTIHYNLLKLSIGADSLHYYLVERPAPGPVRRAVGGTFKVKGNELINFKELFVTPALIKTELIERSDFLFDQLVKGELDQYLKMATYVQWPNDASYYDTNAFEWKLKLDSIPIDSLSH